MTNSLAADASSVADTGAKIPPPPKRVPSEVAEIVSALSPIQNKPALPVTIPGYEVLGQLGQGGMGVVYRARHNSLHRLVAIKLIPAEMLGNKAAVRRFQREARAAGSLSHPHIVTVHDAGEASGTHFLVMEYIEGNDLAQLLHLRGPIPAAEACEYVRQAALGLEYAHQRGLVHRDVKPSNFIVTEDGIVKLLDLGLASVRASAEALSCRESMTHSGVIMGTPDYLAPEQAIDPHSADARSDIYSLGCTFYHLLAGQPPFPGGSLAQKLLAHQQDEPTPLESLCPETPADICRAVKKMMAKRPADRYQTAREIVEALSPFCGHSTQASSKGHLLQAGSIRQAASVGPRHLAAWRSLLVSTVVGSTVLAFIVWLVLGRSPSQRRTGLDAHAPASNLSSVEITNSVGMRLVRLSPGTFWMGASVEEDEDLGIDNERPRHEVRITQGFFLGATEVTQREYEMVTGQNPACFARGMGGAPDHPVESVTWYEAVDFCRQLSNLPGEKEVGRSYRLPTEAEWEYACRAGNSATYSTGRGLSSREANFDGRQPFPPPPIGQIGPHLDGTAPVGSYAPNACGLFDMQGNVFEWCADRFDSSYYAQSSKRDPQGPAESDYRVARGGGWESSGAECRAASRGCFAPTDRHNSLGFRVVCDVRDNFSK